MEKFTHVKIYWIVQSLATWALEQSLRDDCAVLIHLGEEKVVPKINYSLFIVRI